jgi:hypothetical protein
MANPRRGEVAAEIGGRRLTLCLTLGALAELEAAFGVDDLQALGERFAAGQLASRDLVRLLGAGVRGGGTALSDDEIAALPLEGGLPAVAAAVAEMLALAFGTGAEAPSPRP